MFMHMCASRLSHAIAVEPIHTLLVMCTPTFIVHDNKAMNIQRVTVYEVYMQSQPVNNT